MSADSVVLHEDSLCRIEQSTHPSGLRLYGSLGGDARPILERELDEALRDGRDLYVDLSHIDFVSVGLGDTRFPTFNVADSAVVLGIGALVAYLTFIDQPRSVEATR